MEKYLVYPKLRWPIDMRIETIDHQGGKEQVLLMNCPSGISKPLALLPIVAPIVSCFDGNTSIDQILQKFSAHGLQEPVVKQLVELLDDALFLASPKYYQAEKQQRFQFASSSKRPAALAGSGYAADPLSLKMEIGKYMSAASLVVTDAHDVSRLVGLVTPHIDYRRGFKVYANTYQYLKDSKHALIVLLGTAHQYSQHLFHLTKKDFVSPLGELVNEQSFIQELSSQYGVQRSFADEILHKNEHSLELQLPFLNYLGVASKIVPILVGSFYRMLQTGKSPESFEEYECFVTALTSCMRNRVQAGGSVLVLTGVDMAHVGRYFGDQESLSHQKMDGVRERDRIYLDTILRQDKQALFEHIAEDADARKICGFPSLYTMLDVYDRLGVKYRANLVDYEQAINLASDCAVTFSGLVFYG